MAGKGLQVVDEEALHSEWERDVDLLSWHPCLALPGDRSSTEDAQTKDLSHRLGMRTIVTVQRVARQSSFCSSLYGSVPYSCRFEFTA
jgi:hypothetical protein